MTPGNSGGNDKEIEAIPPGNRGGDDKEIEAIPPLLACTALLACTLILTHMRACEGRSARGARGARGARDARARGATRAMRVLRVRGRVHTCRSRKSHPSQVNHVINPWIFCSSLVSDLELDFQIHYSCNGKVSVVEHHPPILQLS